MQPCAKPFSGRHRLNGAAILRGMLGHSAIEVVGTYVYSPEKAERDAGELVRRQSVGGQAIYRVKDV